MPSAPPAPTIVCISSIKRITFPSALTISFIIPFNLSSNSPRYFVPAISDPKSRETSSFSFNDSGTFPFTIRIAKPSTTAVFPVPASPIKIGLFLVLLERICIIRIISVSRPMTGSSFSSLANLVKLRV